jgi:GH15 family glucan-1,4-alpha-glucosidase
MTGYVPIGDYAAIGDGRTVALVARDGSIDWLCLPDLDSPSVFAAVLDAHRGGSCTLRPEIPAEVRRRYLPDTNVLETTFATAQGVVRVTDAMALPNAELGPTRELIRRVDGIAGRVPMHWRVAPAFDYGAALPRLERRNGVPVALSGPDALAVCSWEAGQAQLADRAILGRFETEKSSSALIALCGSHQEPLVFPPRQDVEARLTATTAYWRDWAGNRAYEGPWRDEVIRSALALKLLFHAPSGAIAAAASASLPEQIGGERNWDYRFCWVRDSAFTLQALLQLGCPREAEAFFWWLLHASQLSHPRLQVLYRLDGGDRATERPLELDGHRGSRPVRVGNAAAAQTQLDIYGALPAARLRHLGGAQRARALHAVQDDVLGRARPGRSPVRQRPDPARPRIHMAAGATRDPRVHRDQLLVRPRGQLHPLGGRCGPRRKPASGDLVRLRRPRRQPAGFNRGRAAA